MLVELLLEFSLPRLLLISSVIYTFYVILQSLLDPLRDIPGPFLARFTRWWYFFAIYSGNYELKNIELHKRYGPIVRIAPREYSVDGVDAMKTIYGYGSSFINAPWYWAWMPATSIERSLFTDEDPQHHASQRRKVSSFFTMSTLVSYEPFVDNCIFLLITRFDELASGSSTFDLGHWLQCYAFNVIGEITFGKRFGFLDAGLDQQGVFQALDTKGSYATLVGIFPWIHKYLLPLLPSSLGMSFILDFASEQISDREKMLRDAKNVDREGPPDMMTKILTEHEKNPRRMTKVDLFTTMQANIGAGSDTTAITLSSILYHLITHPRTYRQLQDEIDLAYGARRFSDPVTFKEAHGLPYLQAVIKEGLRLHPAVGLDLQRVVPEGGAIIAGRHLPSGSTVGINPWVAHRNESVWGGDAEYWQPERWLNSEDEGRTSEMEKYFMPFGLGSRTCIGKNISLLEISKLVPQIVRHFEFELDETVPRYGLKSLNRWFVKQQGFRVRVYKRRGMEMPLEDLSALKGYKDEKSK